MLWERAWSISESEGALLFLRRAAVAMIIPLWQYPHCGTCSAIQARWTAWLRFGDSPSIVVTSLSPTMDTGVTQDLVATPSICTVHAPHSATPHPNFVPVDLRSSLSTQRRGVSGSASTVCFFPFTERVNFAKTASLVESPRDSFADALRVSFDFRTFVSI